MATRPEELRERAVPGTASAEDAPPKFNSAVTWRSLLIAVILLPLNAYWVVQMEIVRYSAHPTTVSLLFNVIFIILVLTLINHSIAKRWPRAALTRPELLFLYSALAIASVLTGHDSIEILVPMLAWPYRFADSSNNWMGLFGKYLPKSIMVSNKPAIAGYFAGNSTLYTREHLLAWLFPAFVWVCFITVLFFTMLCINSILRKQWTENERLSYPIVQVPLQVTNEHNFDRHGGLFYNRLFWIGFGIASTIDIVNSLNVYYPSVPTILTPGRGQSYIDISQFITQKPWNAIGWTPISFYPFMIGLGVLLPLDFLFSCWFFYLFWKGESIITVAMAWDRDPRFPYANDQAFGAYISFCIYSIWLSRGYLKQVIRTALGLPGGMDDRAEPLRYRWAILGALGGGAVLVTFSHWLGMVWWVAVAFFVIYFALAVAITRMRAEGGTPINDLHFTGPDWILSETMGTGSFNAPTLTAFSLFFWFNRAYRCHPMPHQLEAFKLAEQTHSEYRKWFFGLLLIAFLGASSGFWAVLHLMYSFGATAKSTITFGPEAYNQLSGWLQSPQPPNFTAAMAICVGLGFALFLQFMRIRFPWWPFHPLAYAVTSSWEINLVWFPLFIAWVLKILILRYSGRLGFQRSLPFFFGLMLGQFVVGSLLNIYGIIMIVPTYQFWQ
ncbi:MAG: hypothetical protein M1330_04315 [Armatimonadetes bacterium]|nr:hypothetical protein [Armatimonadota bacterium]